MKPPISYFDNGTELASNALHMYDPAAHDDQIVTMWETPEAAQAAIDRLTAAGLAADAFITDRTADGTNAGVNSEGGNTGLLGALKGLFAPDAEVHGFAEGVRRGHALLVIHPALETRREVIAILEAAGPIDFDARLEEWRTTGWEDMAKQQAAEAPQPDTARPRVGVHDPARGTPAVRSYYASRDGR